MDAHTVDFWAVHGILFCLACAFFPRITLAVLSLGMSILPVTALGILGWFFIPRILIAGIGTYYYWDTNPIVCILAWLIALSGESTEKNEVKYRIGTSNFYAWKRKGS